MPFGIGIGGKFVKNQLKEMESVVSSSFRRIAQKTSDRFVSMGRAIGNLMNPLSAAKAGLKLAGKGLTKVFGKKTAKKVKTFSKTMKNFGAGLLGPLGGLMSFVSALGVFQPIFQYRH